MIELVSHCWSGDKVPIYHCLLQLQISSLLLSNHKTDVRYTVFYAEDDDRTVSVIEAFRRRLYLLGIDFNPWPLRHEYLFKRMYGRNLAALSTEADVVWFMDVDYLCLDDCLDVIQNTINTTEANLIFPANIKANETHQQGDDLIRHTSNNIGEIIEVNRDHFVDRYCSYAFGGIQIARGSWCREHGYLNRPDWQTPLQKPKHFNDTPSDRFFRNECKPRQRFNVEGIYRIRHSRVGRDQGRVDHSKRAGGVGHA